MNYIYQHLGLGDHIICNGLVRTLISNNDEYYIFVKSHNLTSVKFMYNDITNLKYISVKNDESVKKFIEQNNIKFENLKIIGFDRHSKAKNFDDSFYLQHNVPFSYRWDKFFVKRDVEREYNFFKKFQIPEGEYVFIHDDHRRNFRINENKILNKNLPILRPIDGLTDNIFDYCYLMEKSKESHFIDSSFRLIFDSLKMRNDDIFFHVNLLNNIIKDRDNTSHSFLNFKII
jgi:hypothetical protein